MNKNNKSMSTCQAVQEDKRLLDKAVEYHKNSLDKLNQIKHEFCLKYLKMTETEYLEALNKATNGATSEELMELKQKVNTT
jgi:hypothetical protein